MQTALLRNGDMMMPTPLQHASSSSSSSTSCIACQPSSSSSSLMHQTLLPQRCYSSPPSADSAEVHSPQAPHLISMS
jgi:hypothetical protein